MAVFDVSDSHLYTNLEAKMPWRGHEFIFIVGQTMGNNYAACTCGWKTGNYGQSPKSTWREKHLAKKVKKGLIFDHEEGDIHYDFEDKEAWCECGWDGGAGPDFYERGQSHLRAQEQLERTR